jgi:hypothetical protein
MKLISGVLALALAAGCSAETRSMNDDREGGVPEGGADGDVLDPTITLVGSAPSDGARDVPVTSWVRLDFASRVGANSAHAVKLDCASDTPEIDVDVVDAKTLVVNPRSGLPAGGECSVRLPDGSQITFGVAGTGDPAVVPYDRNDDKALDPFPDDYYLAADDTTNTGFRVDIRVPGVEMALKASSRPPSSPRRSSMG